jgi:putative DNA primase/helicase
LIDPNQVITEFLGAMEAAGLPTLAEINPDGKVHRCYIEGDTAGKNNGWYVLHIDERPAGRFGSWKTGEAQSWTAKVERKLSPEERRALEIKITEQKKIQDAEQLAVETEASQTAESIWYKSADAPLDHRYLQRKGIKPCGVKFYKESLVIPIRDGGGVIWSLQFISGAGEKYFLTGGRVQGCYFTIVKEKPDGIKPILICEGYATGASIHAATDLPVVVAFNAGNLLRVAKSIRAKFPKAPILLCADNDRWTKRPVENPGIHYATQAAQEIAGLIAIPEFKNLDAKPTDFNDLANLEGLPCVGEILDAALLGSPLSAQLTAIKAVLLPEPSEAHSEEAKGQSQADRSEDQGGQYVETESNEGMGGSDFPIRPQFDMTDGKGKPLATIKNVKAMLDACNISAKYDVIRKDLDIQIPNSRFLIDTAKNDKMTYIISVAAECRLPAQKVPEFVSFIGGQNPYNPVVEWISSKPWDGIYRKQKFFDTVTAKNEASNPAIKEFKDMLIYRWMLGCVAAGFSPTGISPPGVLVFQGDQYLGKTSWFKSLVPAELELIADGIILDPKDKDSVYQAVMHWLVELGEVDATFRRSDQAQLKAFLTRDRDMIRRPYARGESMFARRTMFFASVNPEDYLSDPTGNRRYWTIQCQAINHKHGLDMQQVWAEFLVCYRDGMSWYLTAEEMAFLNEHNREFEANTPVEELVRRGYDWDQPKDRWRRLTATEIVQELGIQKPDARDIRIAAKTVREITGRDVIRTKKAKLLEVPSRDAADYPTRSFTSPLL